MGDFDLIIVGTGVAGQSAAEVAAPAGLRMAIVDVREYGGTCGLRGCEPKKTLFAGAEPVHRVLAQRGSGVTGEAAVDWGELVAFKRTFTDPVPGRIEDWLSGMGVTTLHGLAQFTSPSSMRIGGAEYSADAFVIATGAVPAPLGMPGEEHVVDSERFMDLDELPERVAFIGGGYVSFEFAHMAAAAGSSPVILHRGARPLEGFDADLVELLVAHYTEIGIEVRVDAPVGAVREDGASLAVELADGSNLACDLIVHGAGRMPDLARIDLEAGGVQRTRHGVEVDEHLRSVSNERVFAVGDAAALGLPLTPVGIAQGRIAAQNIIEPGSATFAPAVTPSVVFSDPPLASVGMTASEAAAAAEGRDVEVKFSETSGWASSRRVGLRQTGVKTVVDRSTGKVLGAHVLGHHAEELVNVFALAIARHLTAEELKGMLWSYPTAGFEVVYLV